MSDDVQTNKSGFIKGVITGVLVMAVAIGIFQLGRQSGDGSLSFGKGGGNANPTDTGGQPTQLPPDTQPAGILDPATAEDHVRGDKNAPITLIEYSDFECPFCARFNPTVKQILNDYQGKVRVIYRHFPLRQIHPLAQKAAEASECAAEQGKFWEMHDRLFELQESQQFTLDNMKKAASDLKLKTADFNSCLDSGKTASLVEADYQSGIKAGVRGTPGSFINGQELAGALPYESLKSVIDSLL